MQQVIALCGNNPSTLQMVLSQVLPAGASLSSFKIVKATNKIARKFVEHMEEVVVSTSVATTSVVASTNIKTIDQAAAKLDSIGERLFGFVVSGCYWLFAIVTVTDIIKKALNHDYMGCFKTAGYGALAYASLQMTRFLMSLIGGLF